jgi:hypothetical protein
VALWRTERETLSTPGAHRPGSRALGEAQGLLPPAKAVRPLAAVKPGEGRDSWQVSLFSSGLSARATRSFSRVAERAPVSCVEAAIACFPSGQLD